MIVPACVPTHANTHTLTSSNNSFGQVLKVLKGHTSTVCAVAISVDGGKIVSGSWDKTVRVWSMETGEVSFCLQG